MDVLHQLRGQFQPNHQLVQSDVVILRVIWRVIHKLVMLLFSFIFNFHVSLSCSWHGLFPFVASTKRHQKKTPDSARHPLLRLHHSLVATFDAIDLSDTIGPKHVHNLANDASATRPNMRKSTPTCQVLGISCLVNVDQLIRS